MIRRLQLRNWRAYENVDLELGPGATFVVASNGIGKTSLIMGAAWGLFGDAAAVDAVNEIRKMRASLAARRERAATAALDAALDAVQKELAELRFAGIDDQMLVFDLKLNNRMAALQNYVAQGDYAPTEQQYSVFRELSSAIDNALARFGGLKPQMPSP